MGKPLRRLDQVFLDGLGVQPDCSSRGMQRCHERAEWMGAFAGEHAHAETASAAGKRAFCDSWKHPGGHHGGFADAGMPADEYKPPVRTPHAIQDRSNFRIPPEKHRRVLACEMQQPWIGG